MKKNHSNFCRRFIEFHTANDGDRYICQHYRMSLRLTPWGFAWRPSRGAYHQRSTVVATPG